MSYLTPPRITGKSIAQITEIAVGLSLYPDKIFTVVSTRKNHQELIDKIYQVVLTLPESMQVSKDDIIKRVNIK